VVSGILQIEHVQLGVLTHKHNLGGVIGVGGGGAKSTMGVTSKVKGFQL
jgi:hypothetical protein